jgi:deferrochelatase/peroxidase EfeB
MTRRDVDRSDIQAIVYTAFGTLTGATCILLRVVDAPAARRFLGGLKLNSVADLQKGAEPVGIAEATQCAATAAGLRALGVAESVIARFNPEFVEGMAGSPNRSRRLGDTGANAPERWNWGIGEREPHLLLLLYADPERIDDIARQMREAAEQSGLHAIEALPTSDMGGVEPFGFSDGLSQPNFDWDHARTPGTKADRAFTNLIALGEVLLGYYNEYGFPAASPELLPDDPNPALLKPAAGDVGRYDLGRNGSYLVFRQLAQDVRGFWRWVAEEAGRAGVVDPKALAEAMVGRCMDGAPLPDIEIGLALRGVDPDDRALNGFLFDADPDGLACPIGAHIRRANPRTGDLPAGVDGPIDSLLTTLGLTTRRPAKPVASTLPWEKNTTVWPYLRREDDAVASSRFHRILRRGREYGRKIDYAAALNPATPDPQAGLQFICLNANIARQFEFVQGAWIASAKFAGLTGEQDPLLGNREPFPAPPVSATPERTDSFTRPGAEPARRRAVGVPQFVTVKGGAYFFMPGLRAIKWIASL